VDLDEISATLLELKILMFMLIIFYAKIFINNYTYTKCLTSVQCYNILKIYLI